MQLRLKTKITLTMTALVLAVVGVNSTLYLMTLTRQVIRQANERAQVVTKNIFFQIQTALAGCAVVWGCAVNIFSWITRLCSRLLPTGSSFLRVVCLGAAQDEARAIC